ncbi:ribokinase-like isoform X1 [Corticium candelabrum]|uniref:ribokinase-like isoform X1 n=1 Tax=Corticium candelabrum TaxID=121492 RepID=UPI002E2595CF|nr:ribokinase-like isoform X1 [Corticium candelabrum]
MSSSGSSKEYDVVVVGSCMTDLVSYVPRLPKPGETIHGTRFSIGFGGKGANQCVMAARMGAKTAMVAKVGNDSFGHRTVENLKDNGVDASCVGVVDGLSSGVAPIAVDEKGENAIIIVSGANSDLSPSDVRTATSIIKSAAVVVCQLEVPSETSLAALEMGRQSGAITILNPAPAQPELDHLLSCCEIVCPNETEAEILTGYAVKTIADASHAVRLLLSRGCEKVVLTMGSQGAVYGSKECSEPCHVSAESVTPVDTTGAGDAFVGSLAYYLAKLPNLSFHEIVCRSCKVAALSVQKPGTQTSFPFRKDMVDSLFAM